MWLLSFMENTNYYQETKVLKGSNALEKLCDECLFLGDKVLIVFSENRIRQSGLYARVVSLLNISGVEHITYECSGLPYSAEEKEKAIALGKKENVQLVLSIGDEELMYFTKMVAHDYHTHGLTNIKPQKHLPIINVSAILKESAKRDLDFEYSNSFYAHIKPTTLFLDYDF